MKRVALAAPAALLLFILPYPGTVALRLLALAATFVIALLVWRHSGVPRLPCRLPIALWAAVAAISLGYAVDPGYSAGEIKNEIGYTMMAFVSFFALTRDDADLRVQLLALSAGAAVLCTWILAMHVGTGIWNEGAGHGGRGSFASYAVSVLPATMLLALYFDARWQRIAALVLLAFLITAAVLSQQRVIWPVMAIQAGIAYWLLRRRGIVRASRTNVAVTAIVIALAGGGFFITQLLRVNEYGATAVTVAGDSRTQQAAAIIGRVLETPFSGSGFGRQAMSKAHRDLIPSANPLLWHAHNSFLNYGLGMGLPGVAALLLVFLCLLREYWRFTRQGERRLKLIGAAGVTLVVGVALRNQVNDFFVRDLAILFWALNGALLGLGSRILRRLPA